MRKVTLVLNAIVVIFFACFLAYTFFARQHLDGLARNFVTEKTVAYSQPVVDFADKSLGTPIVQKLLTDDQAAAIRHEIDKYRNDAPAYIADLTRQTVSLADRPNANPLLAKVSSIKERIRAYYDDTLNALVEDLRIFAVCNLIAGTVAFTLAFRSRDDVRKSLAWFSFLMFAAVLYCSFMYVDNLTFFRILFRAHMGWWYAVVLGVTIVALFLDHGRAGDARDERDQTKPQLTD